MRSEEVVGWGEREGQRGGEAAVAEVGPCLCP